MINPKVLIVDDDEMNAALLALILSEEGLMRVDTAYDGVEALELYEEALHGTPYGIVFLDITMPGMDGCEVLKRIRRIEEEADHRSIIIMATGDTDTEMVIKTTVELDADDHISKPYDRNEIYDSIVSSGIITCRRSPPIPAQSSDPRFLPSHILCNSRQSPKKKFCTLCTPESGGCHVQSGSHSAQ